MAGSVKSLTHAGEATEVLLFDLRHQRMSYVLVSPCYLQQNYSCLVLRGLLRYGKRQSVAGRKLAC